MRKEVDVAVRTYVRAVVRDKGGRIIRDTGWRRTNTLTKNFYAILATQMEQVDGKYDVVRLDGTVVKSGHDSQNFAADAPEGDGTYGIQVGTGTTEPTRDDYKLESKITHGTGSGQLYYYACTFVQGSDYVEVRRTFANQSGADITINEVGLAVVFYSQTDSATKKALIARSLFTITVPDEGSVTLYYRISG